MKALILKTLGGIALVAATMAAQAVPLGDLTQDGELETGDKLATDWDFLYADPEFGPAIDPTAIDVTPLAAEAGQDNPGLRFDFIGDASPFAIDGLDESALLISFGLQVLDPTKRIVGASLALTGFTADAADLGGFVEVTGHIDGFDALNPDLDVFSDSAFLEEELFDSFGIGSTQSIDVDLFAVLQGFDGIHGISQFELRFLQRMIPDGEVPSPGTLLLLLFGLVAVAAGRRRKVV